MTGLYIVRKRVPDAARASDSTAARALQRLAALDGARDSIEQVCQLIATAVDRATKLRTKIQEGTEKFIGNWNTVHPDQMIRRCRGAESNGACLRYTQNEQGFCDACGSKTRQMLNSKRQDNANGDRR